MFFWPAIKKLASPNPTKSKSQKNHTLDAKGFNLYALLAPFGPPFSINFPDHLNLISCNRYNAKTFFTISGLPFWHQESITKIMFVHSTSWTSFLSYFVVFQKWSMLDPLQNPEPKIYQVAPKWRNTNYLAGVFCCLGKSKYMQKRRGLDLRILYVSFLLFPI